MKNALFTLLVAFFLTGTFTITAQNTLEINNAASEITAELKKEIKFNTDQEHKIYEAYVLYNTSLRDLNEDISLASVGEEKKKIYGTLRNTLESILTEEQFEMYQLIEKRNSN